MEHFTNDQQDTNKYKEELMLNVTKSNIYIGFKIIGSTGANYLLQLTTGEVHEVNKNLVAPGNTYKDFTFVCVKSPTNIVTVKIPTARSAECANQLEYSQNIGHTYSQPTTDELEDSSTQEQHADTSMQTMQTNQKPKRGRPRKTRIPVIKANQETRQPEEHVTAVKTKVEVGHLTSKVGVRKRNRGKSRTEAPETMKSTEHRAYPVRSVDQSRSDELSEPKVKRHKFSPISDAKSCFEELQSPQIPNEAVAEAMDVETDTEGVKSVSIADGGVEFQERESVVATTLPAAGLQSLGYSKTFEDERLRDNFMVFFEATDKTSLKYELDASSVYHTVEENQPGLSEPMSNSSKSIATNWLQEPYKCTKQSASKVYHAADLLEHPIETELLLKGCHYHEHSICPGEQSNDLQESTYFIPPNQVMEGSLKQSSECSNEVSCPLKSSESSMNSTQYDDRPDIPEQMEDSAIITDMAMQLVENEEEMQSVPNTYTEQELARPNSEKSCNVLEDQSKNGEHKQKACGEESRAWIALVELFRTRWLEALSFNGLCSFVVVFALLLSLEQYLNIVVVVDWTLDDHFNKFLVIVFLCAATENLWHKLIGLRIIPFYKALSLSITIVLSYNLLRVSLNTMSDVLPLHIVVPCVMRILYGTLGLLLLSRGKQVPTTFFERTTVLILPFVCNYFTFASFNCKMTSTFAPVYASVLIWLIGFTIWLVSKAEFKQKVSLHQDLVYLKDYALVVPKIVRVRYPNYLGILLMEAASALPSLTLWTFLNTLVLLFLLREKAFRVDCYFSTLDSKAWSIFKKQVPVTIFSLK